MKKFLPFLLFALLAFGQQQPSTITKEDGTAKADGSVQIGGVTAAHLDTISVTPSNVTVCNSCTQTFVATGNYSNGTTQNLTNSATWSSSNASIATTSQNGNFACQSTNGTITATATFSGISGSTALTCESPTFAPQGTIVVTQSQSQVTIQQFTASAGIAPYTFSSTDLPAGYSLINTGCSANQINCTLVGTPSTLGSTPFHIQVTDSLPATACSNPGCSVTVDVVAASGLVPPQLPTVWVDNNEAFDGSINSFVINSGGTGCVAGNLTIAAPGGGGIQATGTYTCTAGALTGVQITNPGSKYAVSNPSATIATGTGTLTLTVLLPPTNEYLLGQGSWIVGPPAGWPATGCSLNLPYAANGTGLQAMLTDFECNHTQTGIGVIMDLDQTLGPYTIAGGFVVPQTNTVLATQFMVLRSKQESNLTALPEPVCAGGIQDNNAAATAPGLFNPDCTGTNMYFYGALSQVHTAGQQPTISGITTVSVNTTYIGSITASGSAQLLPLTDGYVSPTLGGAGTCIQIEPTTSATQECVTPLSGSNQSGILAIFSQNHASGSGGAVCVVYNVTTAEGAPTNCGNGTGAFTLANGTATNVSSYNYRQYMPEITCTGNGCAPFVFCNAAGSPNQCQGSIGPDHWMLEDLWIHLPIGVKDSNDILNSGQAQGSATSTSQYATHLHYRRILGTGDWRSLNVGANSITNAISMQMCTTCSLVGSQVSQVIRPGAEGHIVGVSFSGSNLKIVNDWFLGQSSCIFPGGQANAAGPPIFGSVPFQDDQIGRVRCTFPYSWLDSFNIGNGKFGQIPSTNTTWGGNSVTRKNCEEIKEGLRNVFYGIICEIIDNSGGQAGITMTPNIRNSSNGVLGQNYQSKIADLFILGGLFRYGCRDMSFGAKSLNAGDGGGASQGMQRILLLDDLHYGISHSNPNCLSTTGSIGLNINDDGQAWNATVTESSDGTHATVTGFANVDQGSTTKISSGASGGNTTYTTTGTTAASNIIVCQTSSSNPTGGKVFVFGFINAGNNSTTAGFTCVSSTATTLVLANNAGVAETLSATPAYNNANPIVTNTNPFGFQVFNIQLGDPVSLLNCTNTAFNNTPTHIVNTHVLPMNPGPKATTASTTWNGTFQTSNLQATYPWGAAAGTSDSTGTCIVVNNQGYPTDFEINHQTWITDVDQLVGNGANPTHGPIFQMRHFFHNSIGVNSGATKAGLFNSEFGEGTGTEQVIYEINQATPSKTTATLNNLVWPTRTNTNYTEYGGTCDGGGCNPPNSDWGFPTTAACSGSSPTSACVGFIGGLNGSLPLNQADYHKYALCTGGSNCGNGSSSFHNAADDGTDDGARINNIDTYQTINPFSCSSPINLGSCGTIGPYPD